MDLSYGIISRRNNTKKNALGATPDSGDEITRPPYFDLSGVPRNPRSVR